MSLTKRQKSVLFGLAAGLMYEELGERLGMKPSTVAAHRRKLGLALHIADGNVVLVLRAAVALGHLPPDVLAISAVQLLKKVR